MRTDAEFLRCYVDNGSETAYAELVHRYIGLVYSTALRIVGGDTHLAEDVSRSVIIDLARKVGKLAQREVLGDWLYVSTRFSALKVIRKEQTRRHYEEGASAMSRVLTRSPMTETWSQIQPVIDEAMALLPDKDREVLVLRFFQGEELRAVGTSLGLSEDAARMRVNRALDKLRVELGKRGLSSTAAVLSEALVACAMQKPPAGLVDRLIKLSLQMGASSFSTGAILNSLMIMSTSTKAIIGIFAGLLVLGLLMLPKHHHRPDQESPAPPAGVRDSSLQAKRSFLMQGRPSRLARSETYDPAVAAALDKLRQALHDSRLTTTFPQPEATEAITELGSQRKLALPILREALSDPNSQVRHRAITDIALLQGDADEALPDLSKILQTNLGDERHIAIALHALGKVSDVLPQLIQCFRDDSSARLPIAQALSSLCDFSNENRAAVISSLNPLLLETDSNICFFAAYCLATVQGSNSDKRVAAIAGAALQSSDEMTRMLSLTTFKTWVLPPLMPFPPCSRRRRLSNPRNCAEKSSPSWIV